MSEEETVPPHMGDFDGTVRFDSSGDRGIGRRLYGERHKFDERTYSLHPDDMQIGYDEPTSGAGAEFETENETEDLLRTLLQSRADNAGMHLRVYGRRALSDNALQGARDMVHDHRIQQMRNMNLQLDLRRRNQGN